MASTGGELRIGSVPAEHSALLAAMIAKKCRLGRSGRRRSGEPLARNGKTPDQ